MTEAIVNPDAESPQTSGGGGVRHNAGHPGGGYRPCATEMPTPRLFTIGVYGFDAVSFMQRLHGAGVRLLVDVRQRRGVRGAQYAWANSRRLQAALATADIAYAHRRELAPTTALRQLQYAEDDRQGVGKRSRRELAPSYTLGYTDEILNCADLAPLVNELSTHGHVALFCVERDAEACHRSLVARRLTERYDIAVQHLRP